METEVKKRAWVKDAAIIFLAVLLVLTFFSSTIMNRSLTEAATEEVKSGTITAKVRGKGIVEANGANKVKATGTVTIAKVMVKAGDEVKADDVLFVLGAGDSEELTAAKENLDSLKAQYESALANMPVGDSYAYERAQINSREREIEIAQKELAAAEAAAMADPTKGDAEALRQLIEKKKQLELDVSNATEKLNKEKDEDDKILSAEVAALKEKIDADVTRLSYLEGLYYQVSEEPDEGSANAGEKTEEQVKEQAVLSVDALLSAMDDVVMDSFAPAAGDVTGDREALEKQIKELKEEIADLSRQYAEKSKTLSAKRQDSNIDYYQEQLNLVNQQIESWSVYNASAKQLMEAQNALASAKEDYNAAVANLQHQMTVDGQSRYVAGLSANAILKKIEQQQEKIKTLAGEGEENVVTAKTAGIVSEINCASGDSVIKGDILAVIEVPDMGYTISFSVTNDQARRLKVGDKATISNFYWGNEITATLKSIATDKKNPQTQKLLTFDITGDVNTGAELTVSVGQKSASYDLVVPNSAVRNDNNGSFVYVIEAKNSPIGNRYMAKRVKVEVLASDDTYSAVNAELKNGDFVITTTGAPIRNGEQVRLADAAN